MAIVHCPRCRDEVTVPPGATSRALVRCPLCLEQYLLSEALANAPPLLVIIGGEVPQAVIAHTPASENDYRIAETFDHSPESHWGHAAAATLAPRVPAVQAGRRIRKREPNSVLLAFSWIGGGLLSLILAPLILWWIFKVDPVEIGPTVAAYVPWAVPQQFHGSSANTATDLEPVAQPSRRRKSKSAPEEEPTITQKPSLTEDVQARPGENETWKITESASTAIEATEIKPNKSTSRTAETASAESAPPRPPMPNLTDLLP